MIVKFYLYNAMILSKKFLFSKKVRQKVRQAVGLAEHVVSGNILFV